MAKDSRKIAAILAADVVEYARLMGADEAGTLAALKTRRALFDDRVSEFDGRGFGSVGDSLMAEFPSAVNAVQCALEIQQRIAGLNAGVPPAERMQLRIGVNLGDVIEEAGTVFGDTVNIAARLQALAKPGGVLISGPVHEQVQRKVAARFIATGVRQIKNVEQPVRTFEVLPAEVPGIGGRIAGWFRRVTSRRVRRALAAAGALGFAVALGLFWRDIPVSFTGERLGELIDPGRVPSVPNSIAVLPFVNLSGDPGNDYLGEGLAEELSSRLSRISSLRVAARTSTFAFKGKDLSVQEIADRLGVNYVVEGSVKRDTGRVRVNATLVERASGASRWANTYESSAADFFQIEDHIGTQVITALKLVLGTRLAQAAGPRSQDHEMAYDLYLRGRAHLRKPKSVKSLEAAEQLFGRALAEQPDFARAQAGLCETQVEFYAIARLPRHVTAAEEACAKAAALDSSAQEVHAAVGRLRLETGDAAQAEQAYREALVLVPQSPDLLIGLAKALAAGGKAEDAEGIYRRAIAAQPSYSFAHLSLGNFLFTQGRPADAVLPYERATQLGPDDPNAFNNLGSAYLHLGNFEDAEQAFTRSLAIEPRRASYSNIGTVLYYMGRHGEAAEMFRKAIELAPADHRLWGNLADALYFDSRAEEAMKAYRRAMELVEGELAINAKHAINQAQAAYYSTRLGDAARAQRCIAAALAEGESSNYVHYYVALAELALGNRQSAVAHIRRAKELGYPERMLQAAPELDEIRTTI
ncbi:MAG: tetratricopeptide repeat protein [Steroidobacteraceae bacterium]